MNAEGDSVKIHRRILPAAKVVLAAALIFAAGYSLTQRLPECFGSDDTALVAASFTLTDGRYRPASEPSTAPLQGQREEQRVAETKPTDAPQAINRGTTRDKSDYYDSFADHSGETRYDITEKTIVSTGTQVGNGWVWNRTGLDFDFDALLHAPLPFTVQKNSKAPQVLIYHTHTGEGYLDEDTDGFYESYYSHTQNEDFNVVGVGNALAEALEKQGITVLHDKTVHDSTYNGSYDRSAETVCADMAENEDIKIVLDIHRDALGSEDNKVKTVCSQNGEKTAQMMILSGCDCYGERGFDNWQNNLNFALKLQNAAGEMYPNLMRPLSFDFFAYNEYICDGSLLIEIGTDANSIDEAQRAAVNLANVIAKVVLG